MENKWIYLKSDNPADALALATVLSTTDNVFHVVRRKELSTFLSRLANVKVDYFNKGMGSRIIEIEELTCESFSQKCSILFEKIGITEPPSYKCYTTFPETNQEVERRWGDEKRILIFLENNCCGSEYLTVIDQMVRLFENKNLYSVSGGSRFLPCIRGTKDFRQLIGIPEIYALMDRISFIVTSEKSVATVGDAFNIPVFVVTNNDDKISINGIQMCDVLQTMNYILRTKININ